MNITVDLDELLTADEWGENLGTVVRAELKSIVRSALKASLKKDADLKRAISKLTEAAIAKILGEVGK